MNITTFAPLLLLIISLLLSACSLAVPSSTSAMPQTTAAPEATTAPEIPSLTDTTDVPEAVPNTISAGLSFGMPPAETDELLSFPGLTWGISLDEALDILNIDESKYELVLDQAQIRDRLRFFNADWFGQKSTHAQIMFDFNQLTQIYIEYPDDADMEIVRANLEAIYGSPADSYTYYRRQLPIEEGYEEGGIVSVEYPSSEHTVYWVTDVHYDDYLGADKTADWVYKMRAHNPEVAKETFEKMAKLNPFAYIVWSTNGTGGDLNLNTKNIVMLCCEAERLQ